MLGAVLRCGRGIRYTACTESSRLPTRVMAEDAKAKGGGERYYEETGEHGRAGYYVKTVGNAPVVAPKALTAEEAAAKAAPKRSGSGSAWCDSCLTMHLRRDLCAPFFLCVVC